MGEHDVLLPTSSVDYSEKSAPVTFVFRFCEPKHSLRTMEIGLTSLQKAFFSLNSGILLVKKHFTRKLRSSDKKSFKDTLTERRIEPFLLETNGSEWVYCILYRYRIATSVKLSVQSKEPYVTSHT